MSISRYGEQFLDVVNRDNIIKYLEKVEKGLEDEKERTEKNIENVLKGYYHGCNDEKLFDLKKLLEDQLSEFMNFEKYLSNDEQFNKNFEKKIENIIELLEDTTNNSEETINSFITKYKNTKIEDYRANIPISDMETYQKFVELLIKNLPVNEKKKYDKLCQKFKNYLK